MARAQRPVLQRFWGSVEPRTDGCWSWLGKTPHIHDGERRVGVRRFCYAAFIGEIPEGAEVRCDCTDSYCVNPAHIYLVDHPKQGRDSPRAKLTEGKVFLILRDLRCGRPQKELAAEYGVSTATINRIARGKSWSHIQRQPVDKPPRPEKKKKLVRKLSCEQVCEIRKRREEGALVTSLSEEFGVAPATISHIVHRRRRKDTE